jgi:hypothetical protein
MTQCYPDYPDFKPDMTPQQVLRQGAFGGGYFRPIFSTVCGIEIKGDHQVYAWSHLLEDALLVNTAYNPLVNKFGVSCGSSLGLWESKGWIKAQDPRGWFEWWCRFHEGRRTVDDTRQILRWKRTAGPNSRFKNINSAKVAQVMHHWGVLHTLYTNIINTKKLL